MCTSSKTYALKYVETSNTLLLVQPSKEEAGDHDDHDGAGDKEGGGARDEAAEPMDVDYTQLDLPVSAGLQTQIAEGARAHK